jgi:molybdopterin converting factor small subunit
MALVTVVLRPYLGGFAGGKGEVKIEGQTLSEVLRNLGEAYPRLGKQLLDPKGGVVNGVSVYVNEETAALPRDLGRSMAEGDNVRLLPMIGGG